MLGFVAKLHENLADVCYKLVIFQNIAWLFKWNNKETTNDFNQGLHICMFVSKLQEHVD